MGHALPHAPQFCTSLERSAHTSCTGQSVWLIAHWQMPFWHVAATGHTVPQTPQLAESFWRSVQRPEQLSGVGAAQA